MNPAPTPAPWRLHNFRALGGMTTVDGRVVRDDLVYRSAAPMHDADAVSHGIVDAGIATVIDLRDERERRSTPSAWTHPELVRHSIPVFADTLHELRFDGLDELYTIMVASQGAQLAGAFEVLAEHSDRPVLMHCTAGKDRTGLLSALVLEVVGAPRAATLDDFARSGTLLGEEYLADLFAGADRAAIPGIAVHRATASPPELLAAALTAIDEAHGSAEAFLFAHGTPAAAIARLRAALLA